MMRPRISLPLPAANGTTMVTGRAGQSCATAGTAANVATRASKNPCMRGALAAIILQTPTVPPVIAIIVSVRSAALSPP